MQGYIETKKMRDREEKKRDKRQDESSRSFDFGLCILVMKCCYFNDINNQ